MKRVFNLIAFLIVCKHLTVITAFSLGDAATFLNTLTKNDAKMTRGYGHGDFRPTTTTTTAAPTTEFVIPGDYFICPQKAGQFPHPLNHSQYYICEDYEPLNKVCDPDFLYDVTVKRCQHEDDARCVKIPDPLMSGDDPYEGIDENYRCLHDGVFPHGSECVKYYSCVHEVAYVYRCWTKLFDVTLNCCNYAELTDCGGRKRPDGLPGTITPTPTTTTVPPTTPTYECPPNSQERLYVDPYDCTAFYSCRYGKPERHFCGESQEESRLYFNETLQQCGHPNEVNCSALPNN